MRRAAPVLLIALVTIASVIPAPHVLLWPDTIRDLSESLELARGERLVLAGPAFNFGHHAGPAWIWLQAIPLLVEQSFRSAAIWVAFVASLQFALLYAIGRELGGVRLGLCVVAAAAFPSVAVFQWTVFMAPSWVESATALTLLLALLAVKRRSMVFAQLSAASLGLAFQLHPTTLFYAPAVAWALFVCSGGMSRRFALHAMLAAGLVAVWFAPIAFAPDTSYGGPAKGATTAERCLEHRGGQIECAVDSLERIARAAAAFKVGDVATVLRTAYVDIPAAAADGALEPGLPRAIWRVLLAIASIIALCGVALAMRRGPHRAALVSLALALLAGWVIATAIRGYTAFWTCYFLVPLSALVFGAGFDRWLGSPVAAARVAGAVGATIATAALFVAAWGARAAGEAGVIESRLPLLGDLKQPAERSMRANLLTAAGRDALAREVCAVEDVTVYGELAYALGGSTGLDLRMHCPSRKGGVKLLGPVTQGAWTALPLGDAGALGKEGRARLKGMAMLLVKRAVHPEHGMPIDRRWNYFELLLDRREVTAVKLDFSTERGDALMVYRLKPYAAQWRNFRVLRDGVPAAAFRTTHNSEVFVSGSNGKTEWRVEFETDAPQWVDVHVF